jgi:DNA-binding XRE family transcriptional regulator
MRNNSDLFPVILVPREERIACEHLPLLSYCPAGPLIRALDGAGQAYTRKKNTRKMNKVKRKIAGRPRRSEGDVDLQALGSRLRQLRGQTTQEEFATFLGISQAQLSKYELGQSAPPLGVLVRLAEKFGKSTDWILTGKN